MPNELKRLLDLMSIFLRCVWLRKHIEARTRMAPFAVSEIRVAKCPPVVMTRAAANRPARVLVLDRNRQAHLLRLRRSVANSVAFITIDALGSGMIGVAEHRLENIPCRRRPAIRGKFVTHIARADLALRRMTRIAIRMRTEAGRDRLGGPGGRVARCAAFGRFRRTA